MLLTTIAFETSLSTAMPPDTPDPLLPVPPTSSPIPSPTEESLKCIAPSTPDPSYVVDFRFATLLERLRHPPPHPPRDPLRGLLPLPNTANMFPRSTALRTLMRISQQMRERAQVNVATGSARREREAGSDTTQTVPGGLSADDGT